MIQGPIRVIAICVIRKADRWLVVDGNDPATRRRFCRPLGGGIHTGERSQAAVVRELREEIGMEVSYLCFRGVLENLFDLDGRTHHEIMFVYEGRFVNDLAYEREEFLVHADSGETLRARWRPLSDFTPETPLVPAGILRLFGGDLYEDSRRHKQITEETHFVERHLRSAFPTAECYRYNPGVLRIRIVDERFVGMSRMERDELVLPLVRQLPEDTQLDITVLVLITEEEKIRSRVNLEFEDPSPMGT
jgi:8-oxo-dGTP pyrophosphatase MutT (NUDIX family)